MCCFVRINVFINFAAVQRSVIDVCVFTGSLKISSVRRFDAGTYLCRANNSVGQSPQTRVVSVEVLGLSLSAMGVDQGGNGGRSPLPRIWSGGIAPPPRFCHVAKF